MLPPKFGFDPDPHPRHQHKLGFEQVKLIFPYLVRVQHVCRLHAVLETK